MQADNNRITALASDRAIHRAFAWLHLHEPQLRRWHLETIAIPAPPFLESARAAYFLQQFTTLGLTNPHIDAAGNALAELRPPQQLAPPEAFILSEVKNLSSHEKSEATCNDDAIMAARTQPGYPEASASGLIAPREGRGFSPGGRPSSNSPVILLSAHLDTVFPPQTNCIPTEDDAKILGPGATDNAAGLTALLAIAAALQHAEITPSTTILFAANVGEEGEGDLRGMRHLFSPESPYFGRIQAAIAFEGAGNETVVDRALGSRRLRVTVTGPGGHSWADAGLPNPILTLAAALVAIEKLPIPKSPRTTINCGTIAGGTSVNSIPASATADLDLRSTDSLQLDRTELAVLNTLQSSVDATSLQLNVTRIGDRPAGALAQSSTLASSLRAVDRHLQIATESRIGSTDANLPLSLGVPALAIGAGGTGWGMHTLNEGYDPTGRHLALRRTLLLLLDTCNQAALLHSPS